MCPTNTGRTGSDSVAGCGRGNSLRIASLRLSIGTRSTRMESIPAKKAISSSKPPKKPTMSSRRVLCKSSLSIVEGLLHFWCGCAATAAVANAAQDVHPAPQGSNQRLGGQVHVLARHGPAVALTLVSVERGRSSLDTTSGWLRPDVVRLGGIFPDVIQPLALRAALARELLRSAARSEIHRSPDPAPASNRLAGSKTFRARSDARLLRESAFPSFPGA